MTALDGITLALLLAVVLALLGTMREVAVLQAKIQGFTELLLKPPTPTFVDGVLPAGALERLRGHLSPQPGSVFLVFARKGCSECHQLLQDMKDAVVSGAVNLESFCLRRRTEICGQ